MSSVAGSRVANDQFQLEMQSRNIGAYNKTRAHHTHSLSVLKAATQRTQMIQLIEILFQLLKLD